MTKQMKPAESPIDSMIQGRATLPALAEVAAGCTACDLYKDATRTVFGEGPQGAAVMLVGEQPGDKEDKQGHPFVGPAGQLLDAALQEAGIPRQETYITNAVKHFKWEPRGTRRIHVKPSYGEITACRPWLDAELRLVKPRVVVCLGATAAQALLGRDFRITRSRGKFFKMDASFSCIATLHPSAILRMPTPEDRERARADLVSDLTRVRELVEKERVRDGAEAR